MKKLLSFKGKRNGGFRLLFCLSLFSAAGSLFALGEGTYPEKAEQEKAALKKRIEADCTGTAFESVVKGNGMCFYAVPPLSNIRRTSLTYPEDGALGGEITVIGAKGEFEPASFVLYSASGLKNVTLSVSPVSDGERIFPAGNIDASIVKVWVQAGCAWFSYFSDSNGRVLVPELLLHDEKLVRVDTENMQNYVRDTTPRGDEYVWISAPSDYHVEIWGHRENIRDAETIQPFELNAGELKQIWLTVHIPDNLPEGVYAGTVNVTSENGKDSVSVPLKIRVLPFRLPAPKTNYDLTRDFYTSSYCNTNLFRYIKENGNNRELAEERLSAEYRGFQEHNLMNVQVMGILPEESRNHWNDFAEWFRGDALSVYKRQLELFRNAGLDCRTLFDPLLATADYKNVPVENTEEVLKERFDAWRKIVEDTLPLLEQVFGKNTVMYCFGWDEPDMVTLRRQRSSWKYLHGKGLKTFSTAQDTHLLHAGYNEDFVNYGGRYDTEISRKWHSIGGRVQTYAKPHTGPENPDFCRRNHGIDLYLQDFDGTNNYMVCGNDWSDFTWAPSNYRAFNWVYPASNRFVSTIEFEGFREGIDDVRYATLLRMAANNAVQNGNTEQQYAGKAALQWLILVDSKTCDLNTLRLELIDKIMGLADFLPDDGK